MKTFCKVWVSIGICSIVFGIIAVILSFVIGGGRIGHYKERYTYLLEDSQEEVKSLKLNIDFGKVIVKEGDAFQLEIENMKKDGFESYMDGDTWVIENREEQPSFSLFGIHIPVDSIGSGSTSINTVTITIPSGVILEQWNLKMKAGSFAADSIRTKKADFHIAAGEARIKNLFVEEDSSYQVGAGLLNIDYLEAQKTSFDCGVGEIAVSGILMGDSQASCRLGEINLNLSGKETDYNYTINCGLGEVELNQMSYGGSYHNRLTHPEAEQTFNLKCGIGKISIQFNEIESIS